MHNKFCIIDKSIVINGSYNWTRKAKNNFEKSNLKFKSTFFSLFLETDRWLSFFERLSKNKEQSEELVKKLNK